MQGANRRTNAPLFGRSICGPLKTINPETTQPADDYTASGMNPEQLFPSHAMTTACPCAPRLPGIRA